MSDAPPEPIPASEPSNGGVLFELQHLSQKLDLVAGAVATIASSHHELLDHVAESVARQSHESMDISNRLSALERQLLTSASHHGEPDADVGRRLEAIERAVSALPGAAPGVESTFVALADRLDALADVDREDREALAALTAAVEALGRREAHDAASPMGPDVDVRPELRELTDAQRAVADELAALGPRVNELLDRHPDGLLVPPARPPAPDLSPLEGRVQGLADAADAHARDLTLALEVLSKVADAIERLDASTEERLAAIPTSPPEPDPTALAKLDDVGGALESLAGRLAALDAAVAALRPDDGPSEVEALEAAIALKLDDIATGVAALAIELASSAAATPGVTLHSSVAPAPVADPLLEARLTHHIDTALAGMLRLVDDRLVALRAALTPALAAPPPAAPTGGMGGFEAGAVMGAAQSAWARLEQRIDTEFDDLSRQLQALAALVEHAVASTEALAERPMVTGDQFRRAAVSLRDTVVSANRQRRDRRGGPKGLGSGY